MDLDEKVYTKKDIKVMLERIWDTTFDKEVGMRWKLLQIAEEYGVTLDRRLKKYGKRKN